MFGNPPAIDRVTCQPGLTANGEPTSNIALTIPYVQISADDNYGIITIIYGNLDPSEGTGGDPFTEFELPPGYAYLVDGNGAFVLDGAGRYIIVYVELPEAPRGYAYLINAGGKYLINAGGAYILAAVPYIPPGAKIFIDLVNRFAWTEADGFVAIDTLLGTDPNTVNGWGVTEYDPAKLTANGYVRYPGGPPALIGVALTKVMDQATVVIRTEQIGPDPSGVNFALLSANGNDALEFDLTLSTFVGFVTSYGGPLSVQTEPAVNSGDGAINVMACTVTASRFDIALNGSAAVAGALSSNDRPIGNPLVVALCDTNVNDALQSITIYDALPSTAGLSALSETGVENTAPTFIGGEGYLGAPASLGNLPSPSPFELVTYSELARTGFADAEGNPLTFIATVDAGGRVTHDATSFYFDYTDITVGDYSFALRATDPGGLYVEQQFTITVIGWILANGVWDDTGIWDDASTWKDTA